MSDDKKNTQAESAVGTTAKVVHMHFLGKCDTGVKAVWMPKGAQILRVTAKSLALYVWSLADPHAEDEVRTLRVVHSGTPLEFEGVYLDTVFPDDFLVCHIFEENPAQDVCPHENIQMKYATTMGCMACGQSWGLSEYIEWSQQVRRRLRTLEKGIKQ